MIIPGPSVRRAFGRAPDRRPGDQPHPKEPPCGSQDQYANPAPGFFRESLRPVTLRYGSAVVRAPSMRGGLPKPVDGPGSAACCSSCDDRMLCCRLELVQRARREANLHAPTLIQTPRAMHGIPPAVPGRRPFHTAVGNHTAQLNRSGKSTTTPRQRGVRDRETKLRSIPACPGSGVDQFRKISCFPSVHPAGHHRDCRADRHLPEQLLQKAGNTCVAGQVIQLGNFRFPKVRFVLDPETRSDPRS